MTIGFERAMVEVEIGLNQNKGRAEVMFDLGVKQDGFIEYTGPYFSVQGMMKAFPEHRQAILVACRRFFSYDLPEEYLRQLEKTIARAEEG